MESETYSYCYPDEEQKREQLKSEEFMKVLDDTGQRTYVFFTIPSDGREPLFLWQRTAQSSSGREPLPSFPTFRQRQRTYVLFHPPGEGREPDTMLTYFTRKPPEMMGRNLKKKRRSSLWATL
ncbi:hypothetical protein M5K25_026284 [Dendrobium thyrsiflorum]|uniref:Uncharacterized protein n=1 Tax=Dendrobium thyrsiflorum TaxID=117978 RepID=A0ABD0TWX2_DENTH